VQDDSGTRFRFGRNWRAFLSVLNDERIANAEQSLRDMLSVSGLDGRSFIDVGSGSGLFSLAAVRLGAAQVHSFDYDDDSVACTAELRRRYYPGATTWTVEQGSVLDRDYLRRLGQFDIVYSWGVLHHTGAMYEALDNAASLVAEGGTLFIAIYNDQGVRSRLWARVKRLYNRNVVTRAAILAVFVPYYVLGGLAADVIRRRDPRRRYRAHTRGMSHVYDWFDWLGGYPFEVASREAIVKFYRERGFSLRHLQSCGAKSGCNEFVFNRCAVSSS
jgi:2-polyprenyl-6-hydroxyphenyl methylase/3-demethylubiquinone-9 3-methyltransferase